MLIVGNWKAYVESTDKAKKLFASAKKLALLSDIEIVLAVPAPYLGLLAPGNRSKVSFAAQDLSTVTGGACTGEVTAALLHNLGVSYAIIGHSERRRMGETDQVVFEKTRAALASKITPIVCIGEQTRDPDAQYLQVLRAQIASIFQGLSPKERMSVVIAYEPIWAIGKTASDAITPRDLAEMMLYIRKVLGDYVPGGNASKIRLIYGGSVEPGNIRALCEDTGVGGFLPGRSSADSDIFSALVRAIRS